MEHLENSALRVVGIRQVLRALARGAALKVYLADDARGDMQDAVRQAAREKNVPVQRVVTMRALAHMCRVDVPTSAAAVVKDA